MASLWIPGRPKAKERPRQGRGGRTYTPKATRDAERVLAEAWGNNGHAAVGPVHLEVGIAPEGTYVAVKPLTTDRPKGLRGDLDNYAKTVLDGLNGVAYEDDRLVHSLSAYFIQAP